MTAVSFQDQMKQKLWVLKWAFSLFFLLTSARIIGLLLLPLLTELSTKINEQLGSIYREEIPWKQQLRWGLLVSNSSLPKPTPIINKREYEQHL